MYACYFAYTAIGKALSNALKDSWYFQNRFPSQDSMNKQISNVELRLAERHAVTDFYMPVLIPNAV